MHIKIYNNIIFFNDKRIILFYFKFTYSTIISRDMSILMRIQHSFRLINYTQHQDDLNIMRYGHINIVL